MNDRCAVCRDDAGFQFECSHCGFTFCDEHADPEDHLCPEFEWPSAAAASDAPTAADASGGETGRDAGDDVAGADDAADADATIAVVDALATGREAARDLSTAVVRAMRTGTGVDRAATTATSDADAAAEDEADAEVEPGQADDVAATDVDDGATTGTEDGAATGADDQAATDAADTSATDAGDASDDSWTFGTADGADVTPEGDERGDDDGAEVGGDADDGAADEDAEIERESVGRRATAQRETGRSRSHRSATDRAGSGCGGTDGVRGDESGEAEADATSRLQERATAVAGGACGRAAALGRRARDRTQHASRRAARAGRTGLERCGSAARATATRCREAGRSVTERADGATGVGRSALGSVRDSLGSLPDALDRDDSSTDATTGAASTGKSSATQSTTQSSTARSTDESSERSLGSRVVAGCSTARSRVVSALVAAGTTARSVGGSARERVGVERPSRLVTAVALLAVLTVALAVGATLAPTIDAEQALGDATGPDDPEGSTGAGPDGAPAADAGVAPERAVLDAVNEERADVGVSRLEHDETLARIAANHSEDMAVEGYVGTESPGGETVADRFERHDHDCQYVGQTALWAEGTDPEASPTAFASSLVEEALASREQADFLLSERHERAAVGISQNDDGRLFVSVTACRG